MIENVKVRVIMRDVEFDLVQKESKKAGVSVEVVEQCRRSALHGFVNMFLFAVSPDDQVKFTEILMGLN
jgi:hypothetical protein